MTFLWLAQIGKWLLSKCTLRNILILIGVLVLCFAQFKFYGWSNERGRVAQHEIDQVTIDTVTGERDALQVKYDAYRGAFKTWVTRSEMARLKNEKANADNIAEIERQLLIAKARAAITKGRTYEIPQYIPSASDYELPAGFVRLYNLSLEGEPGSSPTQADVSQGFSFDVGAPSGLTLSAFSQINTPNLAECVYRGEVIRQWQGWYVKERDNFTKAQDEAAAAIPRVDVGPEDAPGSK